MKNAPLFDKIERLQKSAQINNDPKQMIRSIWQSIDALVKGGEATPLQSIIKIREYLYMLEGLYARANASK